MPTCSICSKGEPVALTVNELLERKTPVREIEAQTGIGFRTVDRHKRGDCRFSFSKFKAAKVKAKSPINLDGRHIVQWPDGRSATSSADLSSRTVFTWQGAEIRASDIRPDDLIIRVVYEIHDIGAFGNPRALAATPSNLEKFFALALAEDAKRFPKVPASS